LVLQRQDSANKIAGANKASINFFTDHSKGSLAKVLTKIAEEDINLSKLQSMPIPGSDFKYSFHADMEFDRVAQFNSVIKKIETLTEGLSVLGIYKNGKVNHTN
jgi:prephenate dehydratase